MDIYRGPVGINSDEQHGIETATSAKRDGGEQQEDSVKINIMNLRHGSARNSDSNR